MDRRDALRLGGVSLAAGLAGCAGGGDATDEATRADAMDDTETSSDTTATRTEPDLDADWRTREVTDVLTGESFTIADLQGQPVMLEFFAVWCPVCTRQQQTMGDLLTRRDDVTVVSINTDPNEDADRVRNHAEENGFDWRYIVAPEELTAAFVDRFGSIVTSPPSAPVVRVCETGHATLVEGSGVKTLSTLEESLDSC